MLTFAEFLSWLTTILGDEHDLVVAAASFPHDDTTTVDAYLESFDSLDDVDQFATSLRDAAQDEGISTEDLGVLADTIEYVDAYVATAETAAADEASAREALLSRIAASADDDDEDEDEGDDDDDGEPAPADEGVPEPAHAAAQPPRPSAKAIRQASTRRPATAPDVAAADTTKPTFTLLRSGDGYESGQELRLGDGQDGLEHAFHKLADRYCATTGDRGEKVQLARLHWEHPAERTLTDDTAGNSAKVAKVIAEHRRQIASTAPEGRVRALTAAGGLCAPRTPLYAVPMVGDDGRPVRSFLPMFSATRGGVTFLPPPDFAAGDFDAGVSVWTAANDANPTDPTTKPCLTIDCGDPVTVDIEAITRCLTVPNFRARSYPEQIEAWLQGLRRVQASTAETQLIQAIDVGSVHPDLVVGNVGFTRDLLNTIELSVTAQRDRQRMGDMEPIDVLLPHWVPNAVRADLRYEMPGGPDRLAQTRASIEAYFANMAIRVGWFRDTQNFSKQGDGALQQWPLVLTYYQWIPGGWLGLEQPDLDLGVVRDSVQNQTNIYSIWAELFQAAAYIGTPDESLAISLQTCVNGASVGTVDPATICESS